jgi:anion-transporting  ArsA/GET3 family ATPase
VNEGPGSSGGRARGREQRSIAGLLAAREVVVVCGSGGVGKTTSAAAVAAGAAAWLGGRVLVLTIDPARRLADALGLRGLGNQATRVPEAAFAAAGVRPRGELWAAMLDTKQSWDDLVRRHAPDDAVRDAILANPLYANVTGRFVQSHDYIAMERLFELHGEGRFDLIVVDTPPSRNALDFLDAPERMADFFASRLLRWLIAPYRSRLVSLASRPFYQIADRILGSQFLSDIAEFFILFQSMYDGFVERARAVEALLHDRRTTFLVVTTLEEAPAREAAFFAQALAERRLALGALVCNRVLPGYLQEAEGASLAREIERRSGELAEALVARAGEGAPSAELVERVLVEVAQSYERFRTLARREAELVGEVGAVAPLLCEIPAFDREIVDLSGLLEMGTLLLGELPPRVPKGRVGGEAP